MAIYIELTIILLSFIVVLSVLIAYIVKQTLALKREYEEQLQVKNVDNELWIGRHESESNILAIPSKLDVTQEEEKSNLEQMVTFIKRSSENVSHHSDRFNVHDLGGPSQGGRSATPSESGHYYEQATDVNEYSEYCVPNCEPIEHN